MKYRIVEEVNGFGKSRFKVQTWQERLIFKDRWVDDKKVKFYDMDVRRIVVWHDFIEDAQKRIRYLEKRAIPKKEFIHDVD